MNIGLKKKSFIVHPFFLCCFPVLFLISFNAHELVLQDAFIPLVISVSISFVSWIILRCFIDGKKAGLIVSLFIILFIIYGNTHTLLQSSDSDTIQFLGSNPILGTVFLAVGILGIIFFIKTRLSIELNTIFNIVAVSIIAIIILNLAFYYASNQTEDIIFSDLVQAPIIINDIETKPDVFVFILDEFAGEKQLKMDFNYDLTPFNQKLEKRDFLIPDLSLSNYPHSFLSLASTMNMSYFDSLVEEADPDSKDMQSFIRLTDRSTVLGMFDSYGYKVTTLTTVGVPLGYTGNYVDEYLCTFGEIHIELRKNLVLTYLPISYFNEQLLSHFNRDKLECIFSYIEDYESDGKQPHFVHSHLMLPHGPFIYDSQGNNVSRDPNLKVDKEGYINQLMFTERKILELIDLIQKRSPESVIIVYSDHGYRQEIIDQANPTDKDLIRGFNSISAVYFPDKEIAFPEKLSLVNLYRIFFNTYFDTDYEILEDRQIWYDNVVPKPYVHIDMTNRLNSLI